MTSLKTLTQKLSNASNKTSSLSTPVKDVFTPIGELTSTAKTTAKSTAKSVLEKLQSLSQKSTQNIVLEDTPMSEKILGSSNNTFWTTIRYIVIVLIISFLSLIILTSLGLLPDSLVEFFRPVLAFFGYSVGETIRQTTNISAEGTKAVVDTTADIVDSAIDGLEKNLDPEQTSTNKALEDALDKKRGEPIKDAPIPDDSESRVQSKSLNKAGYCFIGEDRGFRSCIEVNESDTCMSGDIFPSKEICINPNLRV